ncbi:hypothetical protein EHS39_36495 [Ensifer sp. MPMI2T]|nr:hypothetical protein EHS39_36495 [Ensifer sp. MPMI2T]
MSWSERIAISTCLILMWKDSRRRTIDSRGGGSNLSIGTELLHAGSHQSQRKAIRLGGATRDPFNEIPRGYAKQPGRTRGVPADDEALFEGFKTKARPDDGTVKEGTVKNAIADCAISAPGSARTGGHQSRLELTTQSWQLGWMTMCKLTRAIAAGASKRH